MLILKCVLNPWNDIKMAVTFMSIEFQRGYLIIYVKLIVICK